jgi:hypothetical protein
MNSGATGDSPEERRASDLAAETTAKASELAEKTAATADDLAEETAARALALASALSTTLGEIARRLNEYSAFGRRSRRIIIALAVSFALDIILTVVLGYTAFQAHSTADGNARLTQQMHVAQLQSCDGTNKFRAAQDVIWEKFISLATQPAPGEPKAQAERAARIGAQFLAYVKKADTPINCTARYGK